MILIDSNVLIAYFNEADKNHILARQVLKRIENSSYGDAIISDYIFNELITVTLLKKKSKKKAKLKPSRKKPKAADFWEAELFRFAKHNRSIKEKKRLRR